MTCNHSSTTQGEAVTRFNDADLTRRYNYRIRKRDRKKQCVDSVGTWRDQPYLGASLTSAFKKGPCVLKCIARHQLRNDAATWQRFSVARLDATDLSRGHRAELDQIDLVLPRPQP